MFTTGFSEWTWYNKNQPPKFLVKSRLFGGFVANVLH